MKRCVNNRCRVAGIYVRYYGWLCVFCGQRVEVR